MYWTCDIQDVFSETLPQCFSDPALLFLSESWLVREENTSLFRNNLQQLYDSIIQPSAFRVRHYQIYFHIRFAIIIL